MVEAQGGDVASLHDPARLLGAGDVREIVLGAPRSGVIGGLDALGVGLAVAALGGGRGGDGEAPHPGVGAWIEAQPGDAVQAGDPLVYHGFGFNKYAERYLGAIAWADEPSPPAAIVLERCR